jgi:hypothetical protein
MWLANALDMGITEQDFWNMTLAELERALASKRRIMKQQAQEQASLDYILADLIGRSVGRIYSSSTKLPPISEVYPTLFDSQEIEQKRAEKNAELSALRFRNFANSFNKRFKKEGAES